MANRKNVNEDMLSLIHLIRNNRDGMNTLLIVAHRDIDGVISAYLLATKLKDKYDNIDVLFSQPYMSKALVSYLDSNRKIKNYTDVALLDISVDYVNTEGTRSMFKYFRKKFVYLFDHHNGWKELLASEDTSLFNIWLDGEVFQRSNDSKPGNIILGEELCCAKLLYDFFKYEELNDKYLNDILNISIIADDINSRKNMSDTPAYEAYIKLKNKNIEDVLSELYRCTDISQLSNEDFDWFSKNTEKANRLLESAEEISPGVGYIKAFAGNSVNYTMVCEQAYKKFKILVIKELDAKNMKMSFMVASSLDYLDLSKIFNLKAGSPRRITLCKRNINIDTILDTLKPHLNIS